MNRAVVDKIANAVLYEGYVLYPYRPSVKNKQRWTFGGIYPQAWSEAQNGAEPCLMQTECLLQGPSPKVHVIVRFLQLIERTVGKSRGADFEQVDSLDIGEKRYQPWQEAIEREIDLGEFAVSDLLTPVERCFSFTAEKKEEILRDAGGKIAGILWRRQEAINISSVVSATHFSLPWYSGGRSGRGRLPDPSNNEPPPLPSPGVSGEGVNASGVFKISIQIRNNTSGMGTNQMSRDDALLRALVSTHTILGIEPGEFISLTDPPEALKEQAKSCKNIGTWPVLIGNEPQRDTILSSPIILSDYPEIAPESPGDLFDGLEIDEILTLRIMTLTDEEKKNAAATDERVGKLLQRTESLARQQMMNLHGAMRGLKIVEEKP